MEAYDWFRCPSSLQASPMICMTFGYAFLSRTSPAASRMTAGSHATAGVLVLVGALLGLASWQRSAEAPATIPSVRLTGWDVSFALPPGWVVRPASGGVDEVTRDDDWVVFQSTTSTIFLGAAQPPEGEYVTTDFGLISVMRVDPSVVPTAARRVVIGEHVFFSYTAPTADEAGPDPRSGHYYESTLRPGRWYQLQLFGQGSVTLDPQTILRTLSEEPQAD